jgi:hypothetical protein
MAPSANLPIYREAYRLVSHLHQSTRKAPRDLRHTLVQRLLDESVELCVDISDANRNSGAVRAESLTRLQRRVGRVDTLLTIAREQHCQPQCLSGCSKAWKHLQPPLFVV